MTILILMGVSGSGKTTLGQQLAERLGWQFQDADNFHSAENIDKLHQGIGLTDTDRLPWLHSLRQAMSLWLDQGLSVVLACSALKACYREILAVDPTHIRWVYLKGEFQQIAERLQQRSQHFMNPVLLHSQFDTLEEPDPQESLWVRIDQPQEQILQQICQGLEL
jgi:gluconokinase